MAARTNAGKPQLFEFDASANLIVTVGPEVIGYQDTAHGMAWTGRQRLGNGCSGNR